METLDVTVTCPDEEVARRIGSAVVEERLAACAQVSGPIRSIYRWQKAIEEDVEWLLTMKSRRDLFDALSAAIRARHPYDLPTILGVPALADADVLRWLADETR